MKKLSIFTATVLAALLISSCAFALSAPIAGIALDRTRITIMEGNAAQLKAKVVSARKSAEVVMWSSSDESVVRVDGGLLTTVAPGTAIVTAKAGPASNRVEAECAVRVLPAPKALQKAVRAKFIKLNYSIKALSFGKTVQLAATVLPRNCIDSDKAVTWTSSDESVATVDDTGLVTASQTSGVAVIRAATGNGKIAKCKIVVKTVAVKSITLDKTLLTLAPGDSYTLTATLKPLGATDQTVTWKSDDESVATVFNGKVVAVSGGTTVVRATAASGVQAKCKVAVTGEAVSVSIVAGGDITMGGDPRRGASSDASEQHYATLYAKFGGDMLGEIDSYFKSADTISVINLECSFTTNSVSSNKTYILRAKPAYAKTLVDSGIDIVNHANNHMLDFGSVGLANTKSTVRANGMKYVGNSVTAAVSINGVKVGFCGFNCLSGNVSSLAIATIKKLDKACDLVVASFHWGTDFKYAASSAQRTLGRAAVKAGADLVLGHHPHVVSGVEKYRERYIVYSLGTLSSALLTPEDMDTMLYKQTFLVDAATNTVSDAGAQLIPLSMSSAAKNNAHPVKLTGSDRKRVLNKVKQYSSGFTATLPDSCFE